MEKHEVAVITVPFPGQGHLNQLLQISALLSSHGLPVHYVAAAIHNRQARARINGLNVAQIHFHDLPTPPFASPLPDPNSSKKFPSQLQPAWTASLHLREPLAAFLNDIAGKFKRIVVVHDSMMAAVVQDVASIPNAESYALWCISAYSLASYYAKDFSSIEEDDVPEEIQYLTNLQLEPLKFRAGDLYNTCRLIEAPYLEILQRDEAMGNRRSWAIAPILPPPDENQSRIRHKTLEWLDKHQPDSVIYVAFGTTISMSDDEITELAWGLERSGVKFLWVLRDADKGDVFDDEVRRARLPEGFEERVEGVGMVERDWAPQPQILAHPATGGFMSHCGWNSCIESVTEGVAVAAWPMHSDQPRNTALITQVLRVGVVVREWRERKALVRAESIEKVVRRLMASEEGSEIRRRAEELGAAVRRAAQPGGASRVELDSFVAHVTRH
ncbi:zeatin O-xylosyltransferase-like [Salvia miltiorrhiza]|uniref:zeatin O-xylosyltransferase-like n=1 Tax=Salvia miltiorrhiza TaxID=226208 RepID=UPI0025ABC787|nr:zeatin O-xylosyltransferase-like [Salvia miltiorrhiza]